MRLKGQKQSLTKVHSHVSIILLLLTLFNIASKFPIISHRKAYLADGTIRI